MTHYAYSATYWLGSEMHETAFAPSKKAVVDYCHNLLDIFTDRYVRIHVVRLDLHDNKTVEIVYDAQREAGKRKYSHIKH